MWFPSEIRIRCLKSNKIKRSPSAKCYGIIMGSPDFHHNVYLADMNSFTGSLLRLCRATRADALGRGYFAPQLTGGEASNDQSNCICNDSGYSCNIVTFAKSTGSGRLTMTPSCLKTLHNSSTSAIAFFICSRGNGFPPNLVKKGQFFSFVLAFTSTENPGTVAPGKRRINPWGLVIWGALSIW